METTVIISYSYPPNPARTFITEARQITLGRFTPNQHVDLDLNPDLQVSHLHARITQEDGEYWVEDLGSRNGTWVNNDRITGRGRLTVDDTLVIGETTLTLQPEGAELFQEHPTLDPNDPGNREGIFTSRLLAAESPSLLMLPVVTVDVEDQETSLEVSRRRLTAFYDLGAALGSIEELAPMLQTIIRHLLEAIPAAHRGALLLSEGDKLLLKAHLPAGNPAASLSLATQAMRQREGFIWQFGQAMSWGEPSSSIIHFGTQCAMYAPMVRMGEVLGVVCVDNTMDSAAFNEDDLRLLMAMANHAAMFVKNHMLQQELKRAAALRSNLERQFSPQVVKLLMNQPGRLRLGGELADPVTILVTDVRGFTALSAKQDPDDVVQMVNAMFGVLEPIVFKYEGTIDKYVGDAVLAVFGSPEPDDHQWEKAVRAALEMQEAMERLGDVWRTGGVPVWQLGIGIHTGDVIHGFIGSERRMEYTVIGDTVNRAARYCDGAAPAEILISRAVYEHVYRLVTVAPKIIQTKHPETEPDLDAYIVMGLRAASGAEPTTDPLPAPPTT